MASTDIIISHPSQLISFAAPKSPDGSTYHLKLGLVLALKDPELFEQCYASRDGYVHDAASNHIGVSKSELLNFTVLSQAWRDRWAELPWDYIRHITFVPSLPKDVFWDTTIPEGGGLGVREQDFVNLVLLLATEASVKSGAKTKLEISLAREDTLRADVLKRLQDQLLRLSRT